MRRRVRGSRGAKRRWGLHISSPWPKERENKGDEVTVLTACGIETFPMHVVYFFLYPSLRQVVTALTACGMRRRVRGSRGAKRRWGSHISSPWLKGGENKGNEVIVLTARGMRRRVRDSRGAKRRWGPHISSPWLKGRENKGDEVTVLTACGIETMPTAVFPVANEARVAIVLTACGIETSASLLQRCL